MVVQKVSCCSLKVVSNPQQNGVRSREGKNSLVRLDIYWKLNA